MGRRAALVCLVVVVLAFAGQQVAAQATVEQPDKWQYTIAPYLLGAAMDGTVGVKGQEVTLDVPFSDILSNLHFGGMVYFAMKDESWFLSSQLVYMNLKQDQDVAGGTATATVKETLVELVGGYRVTHELTFLAGLRLVDLYSDLHYHGPHTEFGGAASKTWVDPFVGAQLDAPLSEDWWLDLRGDIGGFSVGSKLAWQAWALVGYRASKTTSLFAGVHVLDMDYESGSGSSLFKYDVMTSGPQIGVGFHF
jgi:hypothetical protein